MFSKVGIEAGREHVPDLWSVPALGGAERRLVARASGAGCSPDGALIAYTRYLEDGRRPLWVSRADRLDEHRLIADRGFVPRWSPDGQRIAWTTSDPEGGLGDVWIASASLEERRQVTTPPAQMYGLAWLDAQVIVYAVRRDGQFRLERVRLPAGEVDTVVAGVGSYVSPSVSPDGRSLAFTHLSPVRDLRLASATTDDEGVRLTRGERHSWPRLSPSGRRVASVTDTLDGTPQLYVTDLETGYRQRVSDRPAAYPAWIGDDRVAYLSSDGARQTTEVRAVDLTTGSNAQWTTFEGDAALLDVAPGGTRVAVVLTQRSRMRIVVRDTVSSQDRIIAEDSEVDGLRWRTDQAVAWSGSPAPPAPRSHGVWVTDLESGGVRSVAQDGYGPVWDGQRGLYLSRPRGDARTAGLWHLADLDGLARRIRSRRRIEHYDMVRDRLIFAVETSQSQLYTVAVR